MSTVPAAPAATATPPAPPVPVNTTSTVAAAQDDSDYNGDDISGIPRNGTSNHPIRGRARIANPGRARHSRRGSPSARGSERDDDEDDLVSTEDDDPEYEDNRKRKENSFVRKININLYSTSDKTLDFVIWADQFEEAIMQQTNPHSRARHWKQCLKWLPLSLKPDAYAIWQRARKTHKDWPSLRAELEEAFIDPQIRSEWGSSMKAFMWDEVMPLRDYRAKVERLVDTFDKELANNEVGRKKQYYSRFVNGLTDDYYDFLQLNMPSKSTDLDKAMDTCLRFQNLKKRKGDKSEVGASVGFNDTAVSARVAQNENELQRMAEKLRKLENASKEVTYAEEEKDKFNNYNGRSPGFQNRRGRFNKNYNSNRPAGYNSDRPSGYNSGRDRGYSDQSGGNSRNYPRSHSHERMKNFLAKKRESYHKKDKADGDGKNSEEGCAFTKTEFEDDNPLENTMDLYEQFRDQEEEQKYERFCASKYSEN